jgi:hypothetical protein
MELCTNTISRGDARNGVEFDVLVVVGERVGSDDDDDDDELMKVG